MRGWVEKKSFHAYSVCLFQMKKQQLTRALGGGSRPAIVEALARNAPRTVKEIASELKLSYSGVKNQCLELESLGYLRATRQRRDRGRPIVRYYLTAKARPLLPDRSSILLISILEQAMKLYGEGAAKKLLFKHFQTVANYYADTLALLSPRQRVRRLAEMRTTEGHFAHCEQDGETFRIVENHNPLARIFEEYPEVRSYETETMARSLGFDIKREDLSDGRTVFSLPELPIEPLESKTDKSSARSGKKRVKDLPLFGKPTA